MNLILITPRLTPDDPPLAFIPNRIINLASKIDKLWVITPRLKKITFPENVNIIEVGRDYSKGEEFSHALANFHRNMQQITKYERIDGLFTFMYPEYAILAFPYAWIKRIKLIMWYAHYQVNLRLILASTLVDKILTTSYETCRIRSDKVNPIGQGIDTNTFRLYPEHRYHDPEKKIEITSVGRISPVKHLETIIEAANILVNHEGCDKLHFSFVGAPPIQKHLDYENLLQSRVNNYGLEKYISFLGNIPHDQLPIYYQGIDFFVSSSLSGADKAVFEAMSCEIPVLVSHPVFLEILKPYTDELIFEHNKPQTLANKLSHLISIPYAERYLIGKSLREIVLLNHSIEQYSQKIIDAFNC